MVISFEVSYDEKEWIKKIVLRAMRENIVAKGDHVSLEMDLKATHANGMPLDFQKLFNAPVFDFVHDIVGIQRYLSRDTGMLESFFVPRCAIK